MKRRQFISLLGGTAAWPMTARAQQPVMPVVAFFSAGAADRGPWPRNTAAFRQGLQETGFVEGRNVVIEYRWADDHYDRLPALAADLVQRGVAVIAASPRAVDAAKAATNSIPVVFMAGADPVRMGLVASLNRPGGNLTGVTILAGDLNAKRFDLFHELVPQATVMGVLSDSTKPGGDFAAPEFEAAAGRLGVSALNVAASTESEIEGAFATFARGGATAVFVINGFLFYSLSDRLVGLAARDHMALSGELRVFPELGGLMSYGPNEIDAFRQVGRYSGRILKGEKPANMPVEQPTKFELVINLKTAKALGLTVPPNLLAIADEVIE